MVVSITAVLCLINWKGNNIYSLVKTLVILGRIMHYQKSFRSGLLVNNRDAEWKKVGEIDNNSKKENHRTDCRDGEP